MMQENQSELANLAKTIETCKKCSLANTRKKTVPGEGPSSASIMFVGEAPGQVEDLTGRPFVGRSGKLLTSILNEINISRSDVFITSVIKCRPPNNRNPTKDELEACKPYLFKQIEIIRPKIIITLGLVAADILIGKIKLKDAHGRIFQKDDLKVMPTYHPSAALRFPKFRAVIKEDIEKGLF